MPDSREDYVYFAKLAKQAERYEGLIFHWPPLFLLSIKYLSLTEMVENMNRVASSDQELTVNLELILIN